MTTKMHPTTIRLGEEDQSFLASLKIAGAATISDKVRALIEDRRLQQEAGRDYRAALTLANNLIGPLHDSIKMAENQHRMHSQLVRRLLEWTPELLATLLADGLSDSDHLPEKATLEALENALALHLSRLMDITLQTDIARDPALYNAESLGTERLISMRRLCRLADEDNNNQIL